MTLKCAISFKKGLNGAPGDSKDGKPGFPGPRGNLGQKGEAGIPGIHGFKGIKLKHIHCEVGKLQTAIKPCSQLANEKFHWTVSKRLR